MDYTVCIDVVGKDFQISGAATVHIHNNNFIFKGIVPSTMSLILHALGCDFIQSRISLIDNRPGICEPLSSTPLQGLPSPYDG